MNDSHINYQEYLESYAWKALKKTKLEEQSQCESCGLSATSVHHLSYERLGREKPEDIVSICERCHEECHHVGGYQIKNDEETLRRRFEEVRNIYLCETEMESIELKEVFRYDFSKDEKPILKKTIRGSSTMTELSFLTNNHPIRINLSKRNETQVLEEGARNSSDIDNNPFFIIEQCLYYAYTIDYGNEENWEEISNHSGCRSFYGLKLSSFDIDSFEVVSKSIIKDKYGIYVIQFVTAFNGPCGISGIGGAELITIYKTNISSNGFMRIGYPYYKNGGNIYCEICYMPYDFPHHIIKVKGADLETFEVLDGGRAKDKNYIYDYGKIIEELIHESEDNDYSTGNKGGCSCGEYGEDCETLFSDRSDWCSYCRGE